MLLSGPKICFTIIIPFVHQYLKNTGLFAIFIKELYKRGWPKNWSSDVILEKTFWQPNFLRAISKKIFHFSLLLLSKYFLNPCGLRLEELIIVGLIFSFFLGTYLLGVEAFCGSPSVRESFKNYVARVFTGCSWHACWLKNILSAIILYNLFNR